MPVIQQNSPAVPSSSSIGKAPSRLLMVLAFISIYLIWGSTYLAIRFAVQTIPPLVTAGIRHSLAGTTLLAIAWARGFRLKRTHLLPGIVLGGFYFLIGHGTLHWGEQVVSSGLAALLMATEPIFILVIGAMMGQEKINWLNGWGLVLGLIGVGVLTWPEFTAHSSSTLGIIVVLIGSVSWSVGVCLSSKLKLPDHPMGRAALPLVCGAPMLLLAALVSGEFSGMKWAAISLRSALGLGYLIVFGSVVAFTAYSWLLQHYSPTLVSTHTYVNPAVAVLLGWMLASEALSLRLAASTIVILASILLIQRGQQPQHT